MRIFLAPGLMVQALGDTLSWVGRKLYKNANLKNLLYFRKSDIKTGSFIIRNIELSTKTVKL